MIVNPRLEIHKISYCVTYACRSILATNKLRSFTNGRLYENKKDPWRERKRRARGLPIVTRGTDLSPFCISRPFFVVAMKQFQNCLGATAGYILED